MIDKVSPGKHIVTLVLVDYEKYVQEVDLIASKIIDVSVNNRDSYFLSRERFCDSF